MRKNNFPDKKEWNKIVEEAFASNEFHVFSERYNAEKYQMKRNIFMKKSTNQKRFTAMIAAAAVIALLVPTSVYAYNRITSSISKTAKYQNTVVIRNSEADKTDSNKTDSAEEQLMNYEFGWLPEGFAKTDWHYRRDTDAIGPQFYRIPDGKDVKIDMPYSDNCENYESDGKTAMINYRISYGNGEPENYGREICISFNDTPYLLILFITDGISPEDTLKIIDNIRLVPTDEVCFGIYEDEMRGYTASRDTTYEGVKVGVNNPKLNIKNIGDTISFEDNPGLLEWSYDITLNSVEITDSFEGINTDGCGFEADYSELMDENGNIAENTRSWIKLGNGVDTINEVVETEDIPMHILKLNVTYTNTSDKTNDICICPEIFRMINGEATLDWLYKDGLRGDDSVRKGDFSLHFSLDTDPEKKGGKNHVNLEPGESADVQLAFFVADGENQDMYIDFGDITDTLRNGEPIFNISVD